MKKTELEIILPAKNAATLGHGLTSTMQPGQTAYDDTAKAVICVGADSAITYTVPEGTRGCFDVYLNISRTIYAYGTTPVGLTVNGEKKPVLPMAPAACARDGSNLFEMGKFPLAKGLALKAGDLLTVCGKDGFSIHYNGMEASVMPAVGDLFLYPAGTPVTVGYDHILSTALPVDESDPLSGRKLLWLGSSVTFGDASGGYAMPEEIARKHSGTECYKFAICGTTLTNDRPSSYVQRMLEIDPKLRVDALIVQLSTNDAGQGKPMGEIAKSKDLADFNDATILGAMETIIAYARSTWHCPVIFYTGTYFESADSSQSKLYAEMVELLLQLQKKWNIGVIDLWHDEEMTALYDTELYHRYMRDPIHPYKEGYVSWWTPKFERYLTELMKERKENALGGSQ